MKIEKTFAAYRYFIVPSDQLSFFNIVEEKRKEFIVKYFEKIEHDKKLIYEFGGRKHFIVFNRKVNSDIYICKFSREVTETMYHESDSDIEDVVETNLPFIYIIMDIKRQIILVEIKTNVFPSVDTAKNEIKKCFEIAFTLSGFEVIIEPITEKNTFWNFVESSKGVYEVSLVMNSPNLFGGYNDTNELLRNISQQYNNTQTAITVSNKKPTIHNVKKENKELADAVNYVSGGGGEWTLRVDTPNGKKTYKSKHNIKKVIMKRIVQSDSINDSNKEILQGFNIVEEILIDSKENKHE